MDMMLKDDQIPVFNSYSCMGGNEERLLAQIFEKKEQTKYQLKKVWTLMKKSIN